MSSYFGSSASIRHASDCECDACSLAVVPVTAPSTSSLGSRNPLTLSRSARAGFSGLKPIRVKLWSVVFPLTSAVNTALAANQTITLTTGNFPELASFMVVYDMMRVIRGTLYWTPLLGSLGTTYAHCTASVLADQTAGAPTRLTGPLEETFSQGPFILSGQTGAINIPHTHRLPFHFKSAIAPVGTNTNPGGSWFVLDNTNAPHMAQVQFYIEPLGPLGTSQIFYILEMDVELKMRT